MVLNFFTLSIAISKREREISREQALHEEKVKRIFEENKRKVEDYTRHRHY
ncbi:YrzI family small protein [Solibacillus sp. FSL W7-1436]|uniref:YrzI family small protein n=1 Tax=unclassified Solibacillus TaxID=2637870 RepID=UPI0030D32E6F